MMRSYYLVFLITVGVLVAYYFGFSVGIENADLTTAFLP